MKSIVIKEIKINNQTYPYIIEYKNIKNLYFRVKEDLIIHVSSPRIISNAYVESLLKNNANVIIKMYDKINKKREIKDNLSYLGNSLELIENDSKPYISGDFIYAKDKNKAKEYIYTLAYDTFMQRLNQIKNDFNNLPEFTLKVRKMTSKWGVCNIKSMTVTLNADLIFKDIHLIDYVIIHELCHFFHMNHSKEFWLEVSKHFPYYKKIRKELNYND